MPPSSSSRPVPFVKESCCCFFLIVYLFISREGREEERERERSINVRLLGVVACNPGVYPDWESNLRHFGSQPMLNPLSYASQGLSCCFLCAYLAMVRDLQVHVRISMECVCVCVCVCIPLPPFLLTRTKDSWTRTTVW
ncbi:hypothetical protein HJG60_010437 [Phyllostomus discolor]|uniref:Uncharacterized protein n=1 Tax=Phyllostomus discolor TaxID=89673 RepID=A0A834ARA1_9CHIR|nr:hypothetical protein HJG60_010437 [Phyllostomus discolor]